MPSPAGTSASRKRSRTSRLRRSPRSGIGPARPRVRCRLRPGSCHATVSPRHLAAVAACGPDPGSAGGWGFLDGGGQLPERHRLARPLRALRLRPTYLGYLWRSFRISLYTTVVALTLGYAVAYVMSRASPAW